MAGSVKSITNRKQKRTGQKNQIGWTPGQTPDSSSGITDTTTTRATAGGDKGAAAGSSQLTGMMAKLGFTQGQLQEQIWRDPQMVLAAMYNQNGVDLNSPMYGTMRELYGADPQSLWLMSQGGGATQGNWQGAGDYGNYLASLYQGLQTPGGYFPTFADLMANMDQARNETAQENPQDNSALWSILNGGNAADQFRAYYGLVSDAAKFGLSPLMAQALLGQLALRGDQYLVDVGQSTDGKIDPFYKWVGAS